jgi:hypothetical protein
MLLPQERTDRRRVVKAVVVFLACVVLAFAAAVVWRAFAGAVVLFLGLFSASLIVVNDGGGKPPERGNRP